MTWDRVAQARRHLLLQRIALLGLGLITWITACGMLIVHRIPQPPAISWPTATAAQPEGFLALMQAMISWCALTTTHLVWFAFPLLGAIVLATGGLLFLAPAVHACTRLGRCHPVPASVRHRYLSQILSGTIMLASLAIPWLIAPTLTALLNQDAMTGPGFSTSIICLFLTFLILGAVAFGLTSGPALADGIVRWRDRAATA